MECVEKGIFNESDIGLSLNFGNSEAILEAIHLIGKREGPGELWGEGVKRIAESLDGSQGFAMHVKGLELPAYDPRGSTGMALAYATSDRGGCHLRSWPIGDELLATEERLDSMAMELKPELVKTQQDLFCLINSIGICLFATFALNLKQITSFLHEVSGIEDFASSHQLMKIGERVNNLVRLFNIREGLTKAQDTLPRRFFEERLDDGIGKGHVVELDQLLEEYYSVRGWNSNGIPARTKLEELGINE
jgi:aldehyde:ferredoxin oxidoreductase